MTYYLKFVRYWGNFKISFITDMSKISLPDPYFLFLV